MALPKALVRVIAPILFTGTSEIPSVSISKRVLPVRLVRCNAPPYGVNVAPPCNDNVADVYSSFIWLALAVINAASA